MGKRRGFGKKPAKKAKVPPPAITAMEALQDSSLHPIPDLAVAVWLQDQQIMGNEILQFMHLMSLEFGCVSRVFKHKFRTLTVGMILVFPDVESVKEFCLAIEGPQSPVGGYVFKSEPLGAFLREVADIEQRLYGEQASDGTSMVIFRNLSHLKAVVDRVMRLCSRCGTVVSFQSYEDNGVAGLFRFHLVCVSFRYAVEAFLAMLLLDGKLIREQMQPLMVDIVKDEKVRKICTELAKRNKLIFQS